MNTNYVGIQLLVLFLNNVSKRFFTNIVIKWRTTRKNSHGKMTPFYSYCRINYDQLK
jgi:hypothetical protein